MSWVDLQQKLKEIYMAATQLEVKELLKVVGHQVGAHHPRMWISEMVSMKVPAQNWPSRSRMRESQLEAKCNTENQN